MHEVVIPASGGWHCVVFFFFLASFAARFSSAVVRACAFVVWCVVRLLSCVVLGLIRAISCIDSERASKILYKAPKT